MAQLTRQLVFKCNVYFLVLVLLTVNYKVYSKCFPLLLPLLFLLPSDVNVCPTAFKVNTFNPANSRVNCLYSMKIFKVALCQFTGFIKGKYWESPCENKRWESGQGKITPQDNNNTERTRTNYFRSDSAEDSDTEFTSCDEEHQYCDNSGSVRVNGRVSI